MGYFILNVDICMTTKVGIYMTTHVRVFMTFFVRTDLGAPNIPPSGKTARAGCKSPQPMTANPPASARSTQHGVMQGGPVVTNRSFQRLASRPFSAPFYAEGIAEDGFHLTVFLPCFMHNFCGLWNPECIYVTRSIFLGDACRDPPSK